MAHQFHRVQQQHFKTLNMNVPRAKLATSLFHANLSFNHSFGPAVPPQRTSVDVTTYGCALTHPRFSSLFACALMPPPLPLPSALLNPTQHQQYLLRQSADPDAVNSVGETPDQVCGASEEAIGLLQEARRLKHGESRHAANMYFVCNFII